MEATKPSAEPSKATTGETAAAATPATSTKTTDAPPAAANDNANTTSSTSSESEDFLIFGARPSHLFDDIAITIDSLLTEEVSSLPLLPRTLSDEQRKQLATLKDGEPKPQTGEEKLIATLRKAYKKNLDLAETYSSRNIFTVQYYNKTKRRKILENYLGEVDEEDGEKQKGDLGKTDEGAAATSLPTTTLKPPEGELPTPEQIVSMDKEILSTRQLIQHSKQKRIQLKRQLERLNKASQTLLGVQEALNSGGLNVNTEGGESAESMQKLKESVSSAMEGHEELKVWNKRAEDVIQILDKIKIEREEGGTTGKVAAAGGNDKKKVAGREDDERERKRMLEEMGGGAVGSHGTKEQVDSLLKKLRGSS